MVHLMTYRDTFVKNVFPRPVPASFSHRLLTGLFVCALTLAFTPAGVLAQAADPAGEVDDETMARAKAAAQKALAASNEQIQALERRMAELRRMTQEVESAIDATREKMNVFEKVLSEMQDPVRKAVLADLGDEIDEMMSGDFDTELAATQSPAEGLPWRPAPVAPGPKQLVGGSAIQTNAPRIRGKRGADGTQQLQFVKAMLSGDEDVVEALKVWQEWSDRITFAPVTLQEINNFRRELTQTLQSEGYVFAKVQFPLQVWASGIFLARVDLGPLGNVNVTGNRYYSTERIIRAVRKQDTDRFNYARFYQDLFTLNTLADVTIDTELKTEIIDGRTVVSAELQVEDRIPIHGSLELTNNGTQEGGDWRLRTTLQHLNLTNHGDTASIAWLTNPENASILNSYSGSYQLPFGGDKSITLYGGSSRTHFDDVSPDLGINGRGDFAGFTLSKILKTTQDYEISGSVGYAWQSSQQLVDVNNLVFSDTELDIALIRLSLGYSAKQFDKYHGRNFISYSKLLNSADRYGSSGDLEFQTIRQGADATFDVDRLQLARFQRLSFLESEWLSKGILYMELDGQYTGKVLVPAMQLDIGGDNSVRGYEEGELSGDRGFTGTIELRMPVVANFIPGLTRLPDELAHGDDEWKQHSLQFVTFFDGGVIQSLNRLPGEDDEQSISSAGLGFRLALSQYSQIKFDYAFPIEETIDSSSSGRGHLSLKLQF